MRLSEITGKLHFKYRQTSERTKMGRLPALAVDAYFNNEFIGDLFVVHEPDGWVAYGVNVYPEHRRRGVATAMYDYAEELLGVKLRQSTSQTDDGKAFWAHRMKREP